VLLCIEASETLVEPMCTTADLQQELVPYVLSQLVQNAAFLKLTKPERQMRVKNLTQKMLSGETGDPSVDEEDGDIAPHRFWSHLRTKYGTRKGHLLELLKLLEPSVKDKQVVLLRYESEVEAISTSLFVRASEPCSSVTRNVAATSRRVLPPGEFAADALGEWLQDCFNGRRAPPLWPRFVQECKRAEVEGFSEVRALVICTAARSVDTTPGAIGLAAHALRHQSTNLVPFVSHLGFGAQSSERLAAISELCAWSGGHSFEVTDPSTLRPAALGLASILDGKSLCANDFLERRRYYAQKQTMKTCFLSLPRLGVDASSDATSSLPEDDLIVEDLIKDNLNTELDGTVSSESMLMVLSETTLAMPRRWGRSLRCWRESRGLRDVVFGEPGGLGLELDEPDLSEGSTGDARRWRLRATHPPASALKMKEGSLLLSVNHSRVHEGTPRSEIARKVAARPVALTFATPAKTGISANRSIGETFAAVAAEIAVGELREGLQPLKKDAPPLKTATDRVAAAAPLAEASKIRSRQFDKVCAEAKLQAGEHSSMLQAVALLRCLLFTGDLPTAARASSASRSCRKLLTEGVVAISPTTTATATAESGRKVRGKTAGYHLWRWLLRWGPGLPAKCRLGFWEWTLGPASSKRDSTKEPATLSERIVEASVKVDPIGVIVLSSSLAAACPGASLATYVLEGLQTTVQEAAASESASQTSSSSSSSSSGLSSRLLEHILGDDLEGRRLWLLSSDGLAGLVLQARCLQVMIAAHHPKLFRHFMNEGVAPELFFCNWLLTLFQGCCPTADLLRLWDSYLFERSQKVFVRAAVALFGLLEDKCKGDVDQIVEALLKKEAWELPKNKLWQAASETKVTRAMLSEIVGKETPDGSR